MIIQSSLVSGNAPEMNSLVALDAIHSGSNTNHSGDNSNEGSSIAQTETDTETDVARWKRLYAGNGIETDALHVSISSPSVLNAIHFLTGAGRG